MLEDLLNIGSSDRKAGDAVDAIRTRICGVLRVSAQQHQRHRPQVRPDPPRIRPGIERC